MFSLCQAANALQLFAFVRADLASFKPKPAGSEEASTFADPSLEPVFPKSLLLIGPLFSTYDLNPVAAVAQLSVPVPEGLDLDAWIVPPPKDPLVEAATSNGVDDEDRPTKKSKGKGKAKAKNGSALKTKGKKGENSRRDGFTPPVEQVPETPEERAERERVRLHSTLLQTQCEPHFELVIIVVFSNEPRGWKLSATTHITSKTVDRRPSPTTWTQYQSSTSTISHR